MTGKQKSLLVYGLSGAAGALIASLVAGLAFDEGLQYSIFWGMLGAGVGVTCARIVWHLALKDYAPEMWQISIYMLVACGGWLGGILSTTWGWTSVSLAVMAAAILMALGTRFCRIVAEARVASSLERTLRYRLVDDRLGGVENLDAPLIKVDGNALTVEEAVKAGVAADRIKAARDYIEKLCGQQ